MAGTIKDAAAARAMLDIGACLWGIQFPTRGTTWLLSARFANLLKRSAIFKICNLTLKSVASRLRKTRRNASS